MMAKLFFLHLEVSGLHIITFTELKGVFFSGLTSISFVQLTGALNIRRLTVSQKDLITDRCTKR